MYINIMFYYILQQLCMFFLNFPLVFISKLYMLSSVSFLLLFIIICSSGLAREKNIFYNIFIKDIV